MRRAQHWLVLEHIQPRPAQASTGQRLDQRPRELQDAIAGEDAVEHGIDQVASRVEELLLRLQDLDDAAAVELELLAIGAQRVDAREDGHRARVQRPAGGGEPSADVEKKL